MENLAPLQAAPPALPAPAPLAGAAPGFDARAEQSRLAEVVVRCAAALVACDENGQALIERKCAVLTALSSHIALAWTWFGPADAPRVEPQAVAGRAASYGRALSIRRSRLTEAGPVFGTLAGDRLAPANIDADSPFPPWRLAAREHGIRSVLSLPLAPRDDGQCGVFVLYADQPDYFTQVGLGLFEALAQLFSAILERAARNAELADSAFRDALTGLHNRTALGLMEPRLLRPGPLATSVAVLLADIDHFKRVNDELGHLAGDAALQHAARRLQISLRRGDTVVRWGGEEFAILLTGLSLAEAAKVAEALRASVAAVPAPLPGDVQRALTVSIGLTELAVGETLQQGLARADAALYLAKQQGRNRVAVVPAP